VEHKTLTQTQTYQKKHSSAKRGRYETRKKDFMLVAHVHRGCQSLRAIVSLALVDSNV